MERVACSHRASTVLPHPISMKPTLSVRSRLGVSTFLRFVTTQLQLGGDPTSDIVHGLMLREVSASAPSYATLGGSYVVGPTVPALERPGAR
jgi:hypothetical protein